jgi:hypothetical protein
MVQLSGAEVLKEDRHHSSHYRPYVPPNLITDYNPSLKPKIKGNIPPIPIKFP